MPRPPISATSLQKASGQAGIPYTKQIICLANSFKTTGRCIAGRELLPNGLPGPWIRPVSHRPTAELQLWEVIYPNNEIPMLLDVIDVPLLQPLPHNHQTENHLIDPSREWVKSGEYPWANLWQIEDRPETLWINSDHTAAGAFNCVSREEAGGATDSLLLIKCRSILIQIAAKLPDARNRVHHAKFAYRGVPYSLKLTDPAAIEAFASRKSGVHPLRNVYLCVSLTEPFEKDNNRCHKIVAAIFTNPPL